MVQDKTPGGNGEAQFGSIKLPKQKHCGLPSKTLHGWLLRHVFGWHSSTLIGDAVVAAVNSHELPEKPAGQKHAVEFAPDIKQTPPIMIIKNVFQFEINRLND